MQTFEFQLTREDWRAWLAYGAPRWWEFSLRWSVFFTIAIGAAVGLFEAVNEIEINGAAFVVLLFVLIMLLGKVVEALNQRIKLARWAPPGPTRIEFGDNLILVTRDGAQHEMAWDRIHEVVVTDAFLLFAAVKEEDRIIIPLHAFADRDAMFKFAAACDAKIKADENRRERAEAALRDDDDDIDDDGEEQEGEIKLPEQPKVARITLKAEDWPAVNADLNRGKKSLTFAQSALVMTVMGGVISGGLAALFWRPFDLLSWAAFAWPGAIGLSWIAGRTFDQGQRKLLDANAAHHLDYEITLDASGVTRRGPGVRVHLDWTAIARIELQGESILFGTPWNEFFIAPKHCFALEQDYWDFLSAASSWQRAAQRAASGASPEATTDKPSSEIRPTFDIRSERLQPGVRSVDVGAPGVGGAKPDEMIFIDRDDEPFLRVNVFYPAQDYHLRTAAEVWRDWIVVGFGARVALISCSAESCSDHAQRRIALSETDPPDSRDYFCRIEATPAYLLVSSGRRVFRIGENGEVLWKSAEVGLDGVIISIVDEAGVVHGSGEWDPPGGWRDFRLAIETGAPIP